MMGRATLGVLFLAVSSASGAQRPDIGERATVFGVTGSGFIGPYPHEAILGLGVLVGLEQKLTPGLTLRALASVQRGIATSDDVGICRPDGMDGCLPNPLLPQWLSSLEVNVTVALLPRLPVRVVGGLGLAIAGDARQTHRSAPRTSAPTETPLVIRRGIEIPLGSGARAVRLQYTRSDFRSDPFSLRRVEAVTILIGR